jgi:hypothetical protein
MWMPMDDFSKLNGAEVLSLSVPTLCAMPLVDCCCVCRSAAPHHAHVDAHGRLFEARAPGADCDGSGLT